MRGVFSTCGAIACTWFCLSACDAPAAAAPSSAAAVQQTYSNYLPPLESIALPGEQPILDTFVAQTPRGTTPAAVLAAADEALAKLGSPTKLRGLVQFARARALAALNRDLDAVEAAEESARLLPGYSAPLIVGFTANAYLNRTGQATEYLMRAIDTDPTTARTIDDYEIDNLMRRLDGFDDRAREEAISDRLLGIGWIGDHLDSRSNLAVRAIRRRLDNGDIGGAKALVPKLLDPGDSRALLIVNAYAPIWPDIEAWGARRSDERNDERADQQGCRPADQEDVADTALYILLMIALAEVIAGAMVKQLANPLHGHLPCERFRPDTPSLRVAPNNRNRNPQGLLSRPSASSRRQASSERARWDRDWYIPSRSCPCGRSRRTCGSHIRAFA